MKSLLTVAIVLALAGGQDKTYDLKLEWKPLKGHQTALDETSVMKMSITVAGQGEVLSQVEDKAFTALETVVSAGGDGSSERRWRFSTATQLKDGKQIPFSFQGKTVLLKHTKGKSKTFSLDGGGEITGDDLAALIKAFRGTDDDGTKSGKPTGAELFAPKKPVRVGESWSPDLKALASGILDDDMAGAMDVEKSKAVLTLKSVERRDGAEFGRIDGVLEFSMARMGPIALETPMLFKMTLNLDACLDGSLPDAVMAMTIEMKGTSPIVGPAGKVDMSIDMVATARLTAKTVR